jgi:hypothetical protein
MLMSSEGDTLGYEAAFFGWRLDGVDKFGLRGLDAEPTRLAVEMRSAWRALLAERGLERLKSDVRQIEMVDQSARATDTHIVRVLTFMWNYHPEAEELVPEVLGEIVTGPIQNGDLFWRLGGNLRATLDLGLMSDKSLKHKDTEISPWACIANLDEMTLEIYSMAYSARPIDDTAIGRYCAELGPLSHKDGMIEYDLVLLASLPIASDLPSDWAECAELAADMLRDFDISKSSSAHARLESARFVAKYGPQEVARMLFERAVEPVSD